MASAIIFDLDGTLWDTTVPSCNMWNKIIKAHGISDLTVTIERVIGQMGKTMTELRDNILEDVMLFERVIMLKEFEDGMVDYLWDNGAVLYKGVPETIKALSETFDLYVVSNCQVGYIESFMHAHNLEKYFKDVECFGGTGLDKGSTIRVLMERNHITNAVYVGDTEGDEKSTRDAGIPFIYAAYGFGKAKAPDAQVSDITQLLEVAPIVLGQD